MHTRKAVPPHPPRPILHRGMIPAPNPQHPLLGLHALAQGLQAPRRAVAIAGAVAVPFARDVDVRVAEAAFERRDHEFHRELLVELVRHAGVPCAARPQRLAE